MKKHYLQEWEVWHFFFYGTVFPFLLYPVLILTLVLKTIESLCVLVTSSLVNFTEITIHILFQKIWLAVSFVVTNWLPSFEEQLW